MGHIETKSVSIDVKAQAEGVIEAYAATFNGVDSYGDTIRPGAFLKTIAERGPGGSKKIRVLQNHDFSQLPIGTAQSLNEDSYGLLTVTKMSQTQAGRDVYTLAQEGAINELSIGYTPIKFSYADEKTAGYARELLENKLWEYSLLTLMPADERAVITGIKSAEDLERAIRQAKAIAEVNLSAKAGRTLSGQNAKRVLAALKELQDLLAEAGIDEAVSDDTPADDATPAEKNSAEPRTHSPLLIALSQKAQALEREAKDSTVLSELRRFGATRYGGTPQ